MKVLNLFSAVTILGILVFLSPVVASAQVKLFYDIDNSVEISKRILMLKNEAGTCSASIVKLNTRRYLITAAHCLPKSQNENFLNVYEGTIARLENTLFFGRKIKLSGLTKKTRLLISAGFKNIDLDIYLLPLKDNQLDSTPSLEVRPSKLTNQESIRPFGYPESIGPFGSDCLNQGGYVTGPSIEISSYHPVMEIFCKDSINFSMFNGMSGGPVIDSNGYFVGVMSAGSPSKSVGSKMNYLQIIPANYILEALNHTEVTPSFEFIDYQFGTMDAIDKLGMLSGHDIGIFIEIDRLIEAPNLLVSFQGSPLEISKIVSDFSRKDLQLTILRSSPNSNLYFYEVKRLSDNHVFEASTEELSISTFKSFRRWISRKIEKYL